MNLNEANEIAKKFADFIEKINEQIDKSDIDNKDLKDFELRFVNGKCHEVCIKTPIGEICFCL